MREVIAGAQIVFCGLRITFDAAAIAWAIEFGSVYAEQANILAITAQAIAIDCDT